ncbi:ribosomal protein S6 kinase delta-1 [Amia ocellicauda]|uniref:ribosomal protein S6 kinase delta-1 n=1 Tax=Amia ocellicauda TaxID=2972642 RepID=UPI0034642E0B
MISQRERGELARFYTVTDPKKHQKGYTVYKVTARIISRRNPEDVQEITVWKRYSDFRKLHKELWQIHRNLYRQSELFPPFAKAKVFGRFDDTVIEERRQCSEDLLQFSANIPALYSSPQLEDFFKGGEVHDGSELIGPAEPFSDFLADSLSDCSSEVHRDLSSIDDSTFTSQTEYGGLSSDSDLISLVVDTDSLAELDDGMASAGNSPRKMPGGGLSPSPEPSPRMDGTREEPESSRNGVGGAGGGGARGGLFPGGLKPSVGKKDYLEQAGEQIKMAVQKEVEQDFEAAFSLYRTGVDLLLQGVQGEASPSRREAVKKKTAEYLMRAELISSQYLGATAEDGSTQSMPPGPLSSRPSWNPSSPAEELKVFRVLGVIDKVLLVQDKSTRETYVLKGLRKSSECGRNKKTIIPRCVPNMVRLHKYIISEDSIFLVLQLAEGGKLWSYVSKFLNKTPEESFDIPFIQKSHTTPIHMADRLFVELDDDSGSTDSGALQVLPLKNSPTASSQEDNSIREEDGQESSRALLDSSASSEEECTNSYLTLCNEYEQEKVEPVTLADEKPLLKVNGDSLDAPDAADLLPAAADGGTTASSSSRPHSLLSNDSLCSPISAQELRFFTEDVGAEVFSPSRSSAAESLDQSKKSPMEFFRIDSKDSASDLLGLEVGDKLSGPKINPPKILHAAPELETGPLEHRGVTDCTTFDSDAGSNESVPVISFKEAAVEDVGSGLDEGPPPDLLVNLPGVSESASEEPASDGSLLVDKSYVGPPRLEKPDVLQLHHHLGKDPLPTTHSPGPHFPTSGSALAHSLSARSEENVLERLGAALQERCALSMCEEATETGPVSSAALSQGPGASASPSHTTNTSLTELSSRADVSAVCEVGGRLESCDSEGGGGKGVPLFAGESQADGGSIKESPVEEAGKRDRDVSQLFKELDELLVLASQAHIPEMYVQRWAVELVLALEALHQEGIVCRDLNPNNILLNDRGHIQLTYFCRWSEVEDSCDTEAVARMYCAPEVGSICEETEACDWWSLGAILFELLTGKSLCQCHPAGINRHSSLCMPDYVSEEAKSLVRQLLQFNPVERLGAGVAGVEDIKSHPFFSRVDWPK